MKILYKTRPRLLVAGTSLLGSVFFTELALLTLSGIDLDNVRIVFPCILFLCGFALISLGYFVFLRTVDVTVKGIRIRCAFLPFWTDYTFDEVNSLSQKSKEVKGVYGASWKDRYMFTGIKTRIKLSSGKIIQLNGIGELDFASFRKVYEKTKRGEGKVKDKQPGGIALYILDNLEGLLWVLVLLVICSVLAYQLSKQHWHWL